MDWPGALRCDAGPLDPFRVPPMAPIELPLWAGSTNPSSGRGAGSLNGIEARARSIQPRASRMKTVFKLISVLRPSTMSDEWGRTSPMGGRHWLRRRDNAAWRLGFWDRIRSTWRVTDALGRTSGKSPFNVARLFTHRGPVEPPVVPKQ